MVLGGGVVNLVARDQEAQGKRKAAERVRLLHLVPVHVPGTRFICYLSFDTHLFSMFYSSIIIDHLGFRKQVFWVWGLGFGFWVLRFVV